MTCGRAIRAVLSSLASGWWPRWAGAAACGTAAGCAWRCSPTAPKPLAAVIITQGRWAAADGYTMAATAVSVRAASPTDLREPLHALLTAADQEFVPPLSARTSTTQSELSPERPRSDGVDPYLTAMMEQHLLVAEQGDEVVGFLSYRPEHLVVVPGRQLLGPLAYVTTIAVHPTARGRGVARALYTSLIERSGEGRIATRTWSSNDSHIALLGSLGFVEAIRLQNDRGPSMDTVYYALASGSR